MPKDIYKILIAIILFSVFPMPQATRAGVLSRAPSNLGLVGYWPMDEGTGTKTSDLSGQGSIGNVVGGVSWVDGKRGKALSFDGTSGYFLTSTISNVRSLAFWVYIDSSQPTAGWNYLLDARNGLGNGWFANAGIGTDWGTMYVNGTSQTVSWGNIPKNQWVHLYLQANSNFSDDINFMSRVTNNEWLKGKLDDLRIYNRALSATEISNLYQSGLVKIKSANGSGLVGYWPMNEGAGTKTNDSSGYGNTGTFNGGTWINGKRSKALSFNGSSDYIVVPGTINNFLNTSAITVSAWVKANGSSFAQDTGFVTEGFMGDGNVRFGLIGYMDTGGSSTKVAAGFYNGSWRVVNQTGSFSFNQWVHLVGTYDGSIIRLYINGVQDNSTNYVGSLPLGNEEWRIGRRWDTGTYLNGSIDDVRIYNRVLSQSEIQDLYGTGQQTFQNPNNQGLVGYWPLNESAGTKIGDASGNKNSGTLANATWVDGKHGKALNFNGSAFVDMGSSQAGTWSAMTISAWVKPTTYASWRAIVQTANSGDRGLYLQSDHLQFYSACSSSGAVPLSTWTHVTVTVDSSDNVVYYINGNNSGGCVSASTPRIIEYLHISGISTVDPENFIGSIDDVRIYNKALSATEVKQLYNSK